MRLHSAAPVRARVAGVVVLVPSDAHRVAPSVTGSPGCPWPWCSTLSWVSDRYACSSDCSTSARWCTGRPRAWASSPTSVAARPPTSSSSAPVRSTCERPGVPALGQGAVQVVGARGAHPHPPTAQPSSTSSIVGVRDEPATADDDDPVGDQLHLTHQVARHQHGATLVGEPAQQRADPPDTVEVEAVDRLVEEQNARVPQQCTGDAEPLAHAERVALDPPPGRGPRPTWSSTSSTRDRGMPLVRAAIRRCDRPLRPGCTAPASSSAPTSRSGGTGRVAPATDRRRARPSGGPGPSSSASSSTCRRRSGRGSRSPSRPRRRRSGRPRPARRRTLGQSSHADHGSNARDPDGARQVDDLWRLCADPPSGGGSADLADDLARATGRPSGRSCSPSRR